MEIFLLKCLKSVPELHAYLANRKSTAITDPFNAEPYDERHEEYNKCGLNLLAQVCGAPIGRYSGG